MQVTYTSGNQAVARIAYLCSDYIPTYPITPVTPAIDLLDRWSKRSLTNREGWIPKVDAWQSEQGVAAALHGSAVSGGLTSTFTASQGLLLMLPAMYRMAGSLLPHVIHVGTRTIATHGLNIFNDHSDIMAVRDSGYAILGGKDVQEAQDLACIAHMTSLASGTPFLHFYEGFDTSHLVQKIEQLSDDQLAALIPARSLQEHRAAGLNNAHPEMHGLIEDPEAFEKHSKATANRYKKLPSLLLEQMERFAEVTGRRYQPFEYRGPKDATHVAVVMGASAGVLNDRITALQQQGLKIGLLRILCYRPFDLAFLLESLPVSCRSIRVYDRCLHPGSAGQPLFMDVAASVQQAYNSGQLLELPVVENEVYGLGGTSFNTDQLEDSLTKWYASSTPLDLKQTTRSIMKHNNSSSRQAAVLIDSGKTIDLSSLLEQLESAKFPSLIAREQVEYRKDLPYKTFRIEFSDRPIYDGSLASKIDLLLADETALPYLVGALEQMSAGGTIRLLLTRQAVTKHWSFLHQFGKRLSDLGMQLEMDHLESGDAILDLVEKAFQDQIVAIEIPSRSLDEPTKQEETVDVAAAQPEVEYYGDSIAAKGSAIDAYWKLLSQLFGDRLMIANATGASSIVAGSASHSPWKTDQAGRGPVWSTSLFENNAEFGLSLTLQQQMTLNRHRQRIQTERPDLLPLVDQLGQVPIGPAERELAQECLLTLRAALEHSNRGSTWSSSQLDRLLGKSIWIVGGDGWAYDIGYGGLDHVLASGENINILVLDNELYENTGGQVSKASPDRDRGLIKRKDLGKLAMTYPDVYVASVALGADPEQCKQALIEAQQHEGPSLVLAYCHRDQDQAAREDPINYQKAVVRSGLWNLYRRMPGVQEHLTIDSATPERQALNILHQDNRFADWLESMDPDAREGWMDLVHRQALSRFEQLEQVAFTLSNKSVAQLQFNLN